MNSNCEKKTDRQIDDDRLFWRWAGDEGFSVLKKNTDVGP